MKMTTKLLKIIIFSAAITGAISVGAEEKPWGQTPKFWGQAPNGEFWNANAKRFIYAPAFPFKAVVGAAQYRYDVYDDRHVVHTFRATTPCAGLDGVWDELPVGYVTVVCTAEGADGRVIAESGRRTFWKKSAFTGNYPPARRSYSHARSKIFDFFLAMPQLRHLAETGRPDMSYSLNGYPSKMLSSEIEAIVKYYRWQTGDGKDAASAASACLETAKKAADWLISDSVPAGSALEHFPRTYAKEGSEYGRFAGQQDKIMLIYPACVGMAFVELADVCGEGGSRYLDAARRIAGTYLRLQGEDGTWCLVQNAVTGEEMCKNRLLPVDVLFFLERLHEATGDGRCRAAADRAFAYIEKGPMADWNWEGQFEDTKPAKNRWKNLSKHPACSVAMYLLRRFPGDAVRIAQAEALLKFSEDQFVEWTPPYDNGRGRDEPAGPDDGTWRFFCKPYSAYMTPCALEQYNCYLPIDASAAKLINTYIAVWKATKKPEYIAKARALGDTATRMQEDDGLINTWWIKGVSRNDHRYHTWINCLLATANALDNLARSHELR